MSKNTSKAVSAATAAAAMTTPAQLERLGGHLRKLRLLKSGERLEALLQHAAANDLPYAEFLDQALGEEVAAKTSKNIAMRTAMARFPFVKPLETFDFDYQPSIDKKQVQQLASCHFIEHGDNVIVLGPPGVGKTHLAVALGLKAIEAGYRVLFTTAANLIEKLTKAHAEGRLEEKLKIYTAPRLLLVDEIGYLPIDRVGANLFYPTALRCAVQHLLPRVPQSVPELPPPMPVRHRGGRPQQARPHQARVPPARCDDTPGKTRQLAQRRAVPAVRYDVGRVAETCPRPQRYRGRRGTCCGTVGAVQARQYTRGRIPSAASMRSGGPSAPPRTRRQRPLTRN